MLTSNVYTIGYFQGIADFDPGLGTQNLTSAGVYDIFIQKLSPCNIITSTDTRTECSPYIWVNGLTYTNNIELS